MKKVTFNEKNNKTYILYVWSYAHRKARQNNFESYVLDRYRFQDRIKDIESAFKTVLENSYRNKIYNERFI